jgi:hypothetical protein
LAPVAEEPLDFRADRADRARVTRSTAIAARA